MVYLNNAATSYPKPSCVLDTFRRYAEGVPEGQLRSSLAETAEDVLDGCRRSLGKLLGVRDWQRIFFTSGATEAANLFIGGMDWSGCSVMVMQTEHNSILRPVWNHPDLNGKVMILPCDREGYVSVDSVASAPVSGRGVLLINHCSNVTGALQPMGEIAEAAKKRGFLLAVDVSQTAGCIPVDADGWQADILIFTGHKGLLGLQGTGGIYIRRGLDIKPLKYGGTGTDSTKLVYASGDYEYEAGTQNVAGIAALKAGVDYILEIGVENIRKKEQEKISLIYRELLETEGIILYGPKRQEGRGPLLSFNFAGITAADASYVLNNVYKIIVRTGLHCAPLIHSRIGSGRYGTIRISVSYATKQEELEEFVKAVKEISRSIAYESKRN